MRRRWSMGVVVAIAVAIAVATAPRPEPVAQHVSEPPEVTLALHSGGLEVRVAYANLALTFKL